MAELDHMETALARLCAASPGAWIERKPHGLALHVREASAPDAERVMVAVRETLPRWPSVTVTEGKAVLELSLSRASKADALRWLRDGWGTRPGLVYLGDDVTDEAAFAALGTADLGIKVGGGPSLAEYRVGSEQEAVDGLAFLMSQRQGLRRP
jgi:trehalose-phosphatase